MAGTEEGGAAISGFSQNRTQTTTFHIIKQDRKCLRIQLRRHSKWKKTVRNIPLLARAFADASNLQAFENSLRQLRDTTDRSQIILRPNGSSESEAFLFS